MSESARITHATRRKSLSSGNLSTSDREQPDSLPGSLMVRNNNLRNSSTFIHNGAGNSPRGPHHQLATANTFYDESKEGGALKKFLNRTKSLIWRRPSNAGDSTYPSQNGNDSIRMQRPQHALESISCAESVSELWGSHSSIVDMGEFEMKDLTPTSTMKREMMTMTDENEDERNEPSQEQDYYANGNIIKNRKGNEQKSRSEQQSDGVPTLPPRNDKTRGTNKLMQHSPGCSSTNSNMSVPKEADNSCLVVSDHTRAVKKEFSEGYPSGRNERGHRDEKQRSTRGEKVNSTKIVGRVESFAVSEAPIIPENSAKFSRRSVANGSVALSTRTSRSRGTTITNGNQGEPVIESRPRRRIWEEHDINDEDCNSEEEKAVDEDEETIDFDDNDEYDLEEAASSVFMEQEEHSKDKRRSSKDKSSGNDTKRSKSSDVTVHTEASRRSRSSSARTHGMDTVDMPKRHGGFPREKVSRSQTAQNGLESVASRSTSKSRHHGTATRSASSPAQRSEHTQTPPRNKEEKRKSQESKKNAGLMYKGRPIGSPPPIPAPLPQKLQQPSHPPPPPPQQPPPQTPQAKTFADASTEANGHLTETEPDYGTIKGSPSPSRKEEPDAPAPPPLPHHKHQLITMKQTIVPYGKNQSLIIRDEGRKQIIPSRGGAPWKGSIRSEIRTLELITTADVHGGSSSAGGTISSAGGKPVYDYGSYIKRRLYYPERGSRLDQKSERSGNYCGPW